MLGSDPVMVVKQWEKLSTLSCDGRDSAPRPKPAMPVSLDVKIPLSKRPHPKARPGTEASPELSPAAANVKVSASRLPVVMELSAYA